MAEPAPEFLYRYRHFQGEHRGYTARILSKSLLFFASPKSFNDPFDCKVHFELSCSERELHRKSVSFMKKYAPRATRAERRAKATQDMKHFNRAAFIKKITAGLQEEVNKVGVLSLTAANDNVLMWSHYAYGHTGICLRFSVPLGLHLFGTALRVNYSVEYPRVDMLGDSAERHVDAFLLTKAHDWSYEMEWRILDHQDGPGEKPFPEQALGGVILGARMSASDRAFVVNCLKERRDRVSLFEARVSPGSFSLDIKPYEP
jgi:hypothetical protein